MTTKNVQRKALLAATLLASPFVAGCSQRQAPLPPPVPEVTVVTVQPQAVLVTTELPGRTSAFRVAEIRPQVSGLILKRRYVEGSEVHAGDVLYEIDPAPFQAALDSAAASLDTAREAADRARATLSVTMAGIKRHQATLELATTNRQRYENILKTNAASAMEHDQAVTEVEWAESGLQAAQAQVESDRQAVEAAEAAIKPQRRWIPPGSIWPTPGSPPRSPAAPAARR